MWASFITGVLYFFWVASAILLILIVLIQRGKGGGLSGAFGGVGGHSALGTKAADVMVKVTSIMAGVWILLSMALTLLMDTTATQAEGFGSGEAQQGPKVPGSPAGDAATPAEPAESDAGKAGGALEAPAPSGTDKPAAQDKKAPAKGDAQAPKKDQ